MRTLGGTLLALALGACTSAAGSAPKACGSAQASCASATDCCPGFACTVGSCVFQPGGNGGSSGEESTGGAGSTGEAGGSSSGGEATAGGTSGGKATSGGSSGGKGTSGGAASGGSSGGGQACPADALYSACETDADCFDCGLICVLEPNILLDWAQQLPETVCELPCSTAADCPLAETACRKASDGRDACQFNVCDKAGLCDVADAGDGTCTPLGLCYQGGTATTDCDTSLGRASLATLCPAGQACVGGSDSEPGGDGPGICQPVCGKGLSCASGEGCEPTIVNPAFPVVPDGGSCTKSIKGPGAKSTLDCQPGFNDGYTTSCSTQSDCPSYQFCLPNETAAVDNCQCPCVTTADCPQVDGICIGGGCQQNLCQESNSPGDLCDAAGSGDGTCDDFEICHQGGSATKACNTAADRTRPDLLCKPGKLCNPPPDGGTDGTCGTPA